MENSDAEKASKDALSFLKSHKTGVLATVSREWKPHASAVHYIADEEFNVYILTLTNSRKFKALSTHPEVAFTVLREDVPQTLQMEGMAMDISTSEESRARKEQLFGVLNKNPFFDAPISKLDPAASAIVWVQPNWIRWANYAFAKSGTDNVWKEISTSR